MTIQDRIDADTRYALGVLRSRLPRDRKVTR